MDDLIKTLQEKGEELFISEKEFYEQNESNLRKNIMYGWTELKAVFWKSLSFGTILGYP